MADENNTSPDVGIHQTLEVLLEISFRMGGFSSHICLAKGFDNGAVRSIRANHCHDKRNGHNSREAKCHR
jgi:hypothetical protein